MMNIDELRADLLKPQVKKSVAVGKPTAKSAGKPTALMELVGALESQDSLVLSNTLKSLPKDKIEKALMDSKILIALLNNYTQDSHTQLLKKGFDLCVFSEKTLFTHIDLQGWSALLSNTPKTKVFTSWLRDLFLETLDYDFQKRYVACKKNAAEFRMSLMQYDAVLHDEALNKFFSNCEGVSGLIPLDQTELNNYSKEEWVWFKNISTQIWTEGFQYELYMEEFSLPVFLNFFGELPQAKQAIEEFYTQTQKNKNYCMRLLKGGENDIRESALWGKLNTSEQNAFYKEFTRMAQPLQQLGLNNLEVVLHGGVSPKTIQMIAQRLPAEEQNCLEYLRGEIQFTQSLSLVHFVLGATEVDTLLKLGTSPKACEKVFEALNDPMTLRCFTQTTDFSYYKKILKAFPQLVHWRDSHNNSILHYSLALNKHNTVAYAQHSANCIINIILSNSHLRDENNKGVSLRSMGHAADPKLLADYDKKALTLAIKNAGHNGKPAKTVKRKI